MLDYLLGLFSHDLAIDLGTANTVVHVRGKGIMIREPSVVARHKKSKRILAIGSEAKRMMGKTPATIEAFRPLKNGVIADFDATEAMLTFFVKKAHEVPGSWLPISPKPRVIIGIPSGVTEVERRAVHHAAIAAGAREAFLIEEAMAGAIGTRLPIHTSSGSMIIDVGGGTTEIAVLSLGGIVLSHSLRVAGDELDEAIINFLRLKYSLLIGFSTAEQIKIEIGSARPKKILETEDRSSEKKHAVVRGRDLESGLPKSVRLTESEIREALAPTVQQITDAIAEVAQELPPELVPDILERGIALTGGGSLLGGFDDAIAERTKFPVWRVESPLNTVVSGCALLLENEKLLRRVNITAGLSK